MNQIIGAASILLAATLANAQDAPMRFKSTEVVPGIYMLEGDGGFAGGNIGLLVGDAEFGPGGLPVMTFSDAVTFHVNGHEAFIFHIEAAHTDGDAVIHYRNVNVIQAGDIMFNHLFPFIDLDNGGTVDGYIAGQQRILMMADDETIIIPGHGPLATKADLERDLDVLIDCKARVKALVDQGKSESEVHAANPLAVYHEGWNWDFITTERMTQTLYRDLRSEQPN